MSKPIHGEIRSSGAIGPLLLTVWHQEADAPDVSGFQAQVASFAASRGRPVGLLLVVPEGVPLSSRSARDAAGNMVRSLQGKCAAIAVVVEGSGLRTVAIRAMFIGVNLVARPSFPWRMFPGTDPATDWLLDQLAADDQPVPPIDDVRAELACVRSGRERLSARAS